MAACLLAEKIQIYQTNDAGKTWFSPLPDAPPLNSIFFLNEKYGFAAGFNIIRMGVILRTVDGGKTWKRYDLETPWLQDIFFTDPSNGWYVGDYGCILRSSDSGRTWGGVETELLGNGYALFEDITFTPDGKNGFICGAESFFLVYGEPTGINYPAVGKGRGIISYGKTRLPFFNHQCAAEYDFLYDLHGRLISGKNPSFLKLPQFIIVGR